MKFQCEEYPALKLGINDRIVQFVDGLYDTDDPEQIAALEDNILPITIVIEVNDASQITIKATPDVVPAETAPVVEAAPVVEVAPDLEPEPEAVEPAPVEIPAEETETAVVDVAAPADPNQAAAPATWGVDVPPVVINAD
jgi:hypothetical protein